MTIPFAFWYAVHWYYSLWCIARHLMPLAKAQIYPGRMKNSLSIMLDDATCAFNMQTHLLSLIPTATTVVIVVNDVIVENQKKRDDSFIFMLHCWDSYEKFAWSYDVGTVACMETKMKSISFYAIKALTKNWEKKN